jgi:hypothetical protein
VPVVVAEPPVAPVPLELVEPLVEALVLAWEDVVGEPPAPLLLVLLHAPSIPTSISVETKTAARLFECMSKLLSSRLEGER